MGYGIDASREHHRKGLFDMYCKFVILREDSNPTIIFGLYSTEIFVKNNSPQNSLENPCSVWDIF